jgi:hypothetical protein
VKVWLVCFSKKRKKEVMTTTATTTQQPQPPPQSPVATVDSTLLRIPEKALPPERIVFVIDLAAGMNRTWVWNGKKTARLDTIK